MEQRMQAKSVKMNVTVTLTFKSFSKDFREVVVNYDLASSNGHHRTDQVSVNDLDSLFKTKDGVFCLVLSNPYINEKLIGKKIRGLMPIVDGSKDYIEKIKEEAAKWEKREKQKEWENLPEKLLVKPVFHSSGQSFITLNDGISLIGDEIESKIKLVDDQISWVMDWDSFIETEIDRDWLIRESNKVKDARLKEKERQRRFREEKFREARETGEAVILSSIFLTGDDIPYKFREEDSDMGNLITFAMPDGSIKEAFSHSY